MTDYRLELTAAEVDALCSLVGQCPCADLLWRMMSGTNNDGTMAADLPPGGVAQLRQAFEQEESLLASRGGTLGMKITQILYSQNSKS